jgi:predicted enzyme involved in methoxymalonyl-ACP biosynthesis
VETALLAYLAGEAMIHGARRLEGWFLPTKKNAPARAFYADHNFTLASETEQGQLWTMDLEHSTLQSPEWVRLLIPAVETA